MIQIEVGVLSVIVMYLQRKVWKGCSWNIVHAGFPSGLVSFFGFPRGPLKNPWFGECHQHQTKIQTDGIYAGWWFGGVDIPPTVMALSKGYPLTRWWIIIFSIQRPRSGMHPFSDTPIYSVWATKNTSVDGLISGVILGQLLGPNYNSQQDFFLTSMRWDRGICHPSYE